MMASGEEEAVRAMAGDDKTAILDSLAWESEMHQLWHLIRGKGWLKKGACLNGPETGQVTHA